MNTHQKRRRAVKWAILSILFLAIAFLFGPFAIRASYLATTPKATIEALKQRYQVLDSAESCLTERERLASAYRRSYIADWLSLRGVTRDGGCDEGVENASLLRYTFIMTCWRWNDIFKYWFQPAIRKSPEYLQSDLP